MINDLIGKSFKFANIDDDKMEVISIGEHKIEVKQYCSRSFLMDKDMFLDCIKMGILKEIKND